MNPASIGLITIAATEYKAPLPVVTHILNLRDSMEAMNALVRANSSQGQGDIDAFIADYPEIESLRAQLQSLEQTAMCNADACKMAEMDRDTAREQLEAQQKINNELYMETASLRTLLAAMYAQLKEPPP